MIVLGYLCAWETALDSDVVVCHSWICTVSSIIMSWIMLGECLGKA